jgi:hypothetical protein
METRWWPDADDNRGHTLNLEGVLALRFVEQWGLVVGRRGQEDASGRAPLELMPVEEVIERAVAMAEGIVTALEVRGWIRPDARTAEELARRAGELGRIQEDVLYDRGNRQRRGLAPEV